jgi:hypothetical protein
MDPPAPNVIVPEEADAWDTIEAPHADAAIPQYVHAHSDAMVHVPTTSPEHVPFVMKQGEGFITGPLHNAAASEVVLPASFVKSKVAGVHAVSVDTMVAAKATLQRARTSRRSLPPRHLCRFVLGLKVDARYKATRGGIEHGRYAAIAACTAGGEKGTPRKSRPPVVTSRAMKADLDGVTATRSGGAPTPTACKPTRSA